MNDLITIKYDRNENPVVSGRELHKALEVKEKYTQWFKRMCEYGFAENSEYLLVSEKTETNNPKNPYTTVIDHALTIEMAKEICMLQRTEIGSKIRKYFIEVEKRYKTMQLNYSGLSPQLQLLINMEQKQKQLEQRQQEQVVKLNDTNQRLDNMCEVIALDKNSWRKDAQHLVAKISRATGDGCGNINNVYEEIYKLVESRAGVALGIRLTNKRNRMAGEGVCKSKLDKLNKMDIIADDKKLIEIYIAIVKEMAVKYGVCSGGEKE